MLFSISREPRLFVPQNSVTQNVADAEAISQTALRLEDHGDFDKAIYHHRYALELQPSEPNYHFRLGSALAKAGLIEEGLKYMRSAAGMPTAHPVLRSFWSDALASFCEPDISASEYIELVEAAGKNLDADAYFAANLISRRRPDLALKVAPEGFGRRCAALTLNETRSFPKGTVLIYFTARSFSIVFPHSFSFRRLLVDRLMTLLPYLNRAATDLSVSGYCILALDDRPEGDSLQLCFSGRTKDQLLIPDPSFIGSSGYATHRSSFAQNFIEWTMRRDTAYWRGSLTGVAGTWETVLSLPRVELSLLSLHEPCLNAKLLRTGLAQYANYEPYLTNTFEALGVLTDYEPDLDNLKYKYLIDIDGNTNSWPGLFTKLIAGGTIIKLKSPYSQWYYWRLKERTNYLPIDSISPGLRDAVTWLRQNDEAAREMGIAAQELAAHLTIETEYASFLEAINRGLHQ
jgi:tetratricopeptide (TPR) repeat protein